MEAPATATCARYLMSVRRLGVRPASALRASNGARLHIPFNTDTLEAPHCTRLFLCNTRPALDSDVLDRTISYGPYTCGRMREREIENMLRKAKWMALAVAGLVLSGCAGPRISPGTKLVNLAPACGADPQHNFISEREDPRSKFALEQAGAMGAFVGVSAVAGAAGTTAAATAMPLGVIPVALAVNKSVNKERARYAGVVLRARVADIKRGDYDLYGTEHLWGLDKETMPTKAQIRERLDVVIFEGGGGAYAPKTLGVQEGDMVDVKTVYGRYAEQRPIFSRYTFGSSDFNRHVVRISRIVCKRDDDVCMSVPDNRIAGILCRHRQPEYPVEEYLIPDEDVNQAIAKEKIEKADSPWEM